MSDVLKEPVRNVLVENVLDVHNEYLVTNGLGGYSSGSLAGSPSRRYHGVLVASLPPPWGRTIVLNHLAESVQCGEASWNLSHDEWGEDFMSPQKNYSVSFALENGLPRWTYFDEYYELEKRIFMPYQRNTVHVQYTLKKSKGSATLKLKPAFHLRHHETPVDPAFSSSYILKSDQHKLEVHAPRSDITIRVGIHGSQGEFQFEEPRYHSVHYPFEKARGYASSDRLWCPGFFQCELKEGQSVTMVASTELEDAFASTYSKEQNREQQRRHDLLALATVDSDDFVKELILAADQFIVLPFYRSAESAKQRGSGQEGRSVIAGYHWFTDWGRDTMISLEGLALCTGRLQEAASILRTFNQKLRDGLIPNMFPDGQQQGLYHTADATLWFFHAMERYVQITKDRDLLREILPSFRDIIHHHVRGTHFGIHVDPKDGLLSQGQEGYQLTWMDAKVGDWVVTPRRGKAVEINALWYNALSLFNQWNQEEGQEPEFMALAKQVQESFNARFWNEGEGCLYDVIDGAQGDDPAVRINQIFAVSLPHAVLDRERWKAVLDVVTKELLTPYGMRSLSRKHPDYKMQYHGDLRTRDAAYHQGTVWGWLIGPFVDAYLKVHPEDRVQARKFLEAFRDHMSIAGIGSISEVFDAEAPHIPRGCPAQAWSVAEVLRCWQKTSSLWMV